MISSLPTVSSFPESTCLTALGTHRRKHSIRAVFRSLSFLTLIALFYAYSSDEYVENASSEYITSVHNQENSNDYVAATIPFETSFSPYFSSSQQSRKIFSIFQEKADPKWLIIFYIIGVLYMFIALAIVCDEMFVPALEEISSSRHLNLSMDVSGATLMAAGGSAPELFTSFIGTFTKSDVGFGTIVGSAVFNVLFVIGMCSLLSKEILTLTWWPLFRDCLYYSIGLTILALFVGVVSKGEITWWESLILFIMYIGYIILMVFNRRIYKFLTGKELQNFEEAEPPNGEIFRAGIIKLLIEPESWVDRAGIGLVANISGNVNEVFTIADKDGNGMIDIVELHSLFKLLDFHLTDIELNEVMKDLDGDNDGLISEKEFKAWYLRSEQNIKERVKVTFDQFDANNSGTLEKNEVIALLQRLDPGVTEEDVDDAFKACYKDGSKDEISFEEFTEWYISSVIYNEQLQKEEDDEVPNSICEALAPPKNKACFKLIKWIILLPLLASLTFTVPDVRRPSMAKYCYLSFILSIVWIGIYSYLMVGWAESIGNALGIPSYIMGLTFLAAGTSVPDLLSSVIVARRGYGDMAISSSIGSNIFDILVGLPLPWFIYTIWPTTDDVVLIGADGVWVSIFILLGMLVVIVVTIHFQGWRLTKCLGFTMFFFYILFLVYSILDEYVL